MKPPHNQDIYYPHSPQILSHSFMTSPSQRPVTRQPSSCRRDGLLHFLEPHKIKSHSTNSLSSFTYFEISFYCWIALYLWIYHSLSIHLMIDIWILHDTFWLLQIFWVFISLHGHMLVTVFQCIPGDGNAVR